MDISLAAAFVGDGGKTHRVLGVRLLPYCAWHSLLLDTIESPFVGGLTSCELWDVRTAVGVCRLRPFDCRVRRPSLADPRTLASLLRRNVQGQADAFLAYAGDWLTAGKPDYNIVPPELKGAPPPPTPQRGSAPELVRLVADVIGWSHWPEERVWAMPLGRLYWYQMMAHRAQGLAVDYLTEEERRFQEDAAAAEAEGKVELVKAR